jgi:hypothetical protein
MKYVFIAILGKEVHRPAEIGIPLQRNILK